jgi:hypothetical protein
MSTTTTDTNSVISSTTTVNISLTASITVATTA